VTVQGLYALTACLHPHTLTHRIRLIHCIVIFGEQNCNNSVIHDGTSLANGQDLSHLEKQVLLHAGDIVCGYVDGVLTLEQTIRVAYERAMRSAQSARGGLMASVGLPADVAEARVSARGALGTVVACDNSSSNVTLAGEKPRRFKKSTVFCGILDLRHKGL
jgi:hypothetical protein